MIRWSGLTLVGLLGAVGAAACSNGSGTPDAGNTDVQTVNDVQMTDVTGTDATSNTEGGTCTNGYMVSPGDAGTCFKATSCNGMPFCPGMVQNTPARSQFVITQIDVQSPASIRPMTAIGGLLNANIAAGSFFWGMSFDLTANTFRTGALHNDATPGVGTGYLLSSFTYYNHDATNGDPNHWDPVTGTITQANGRFSTSQIDLVTVPVFNSSDHSFLAELPLRNVVLRDTLADTTGNCIGTAKTPFSSCLKGKWNTADTAMMPYAVLDGYLTVADSLAVTIVDLGNMPLCNFIAGTPCMDTSGNMVDLVTFCGDPANNCTPPDSMINGATSPNAWHVVANFAAVSANIQ